MAEESFQIDGSHDLDTYFIDGKMYINIDDLIGWLKLNQEQMNEEVVHDIIKALIRCKHKHKDKL